MRTHPIQPPYYATLPPSTYDNDIMECAFSVALWGQSNVIEVFVLSLLTDREKMRERLRGQ